MSATATGLTARSRNSRCWRPSCWMRNWPGLRLSLSTAESPAALGENSRSACGPRFEREAAADHLLRLGQEQLHHTVEVVHGYTVHLGRYHCEAVDLQFQNVRLEAKLLDLLADGHGHGSVSTVGCAKFGILRRRLAKADIQRGCALSGSCQVPAAREFHSTAKMNCGREN